MDYLKLKQALLTKSHKEERVNIYVKYLQDLATRKNKDGNVEAYWFKSNMNHQLAFDLYEKVAIDGLFIDGETITIGYKKRVIITYNYQAYKNKVLMTYPDTVFDIQLVYKGDKFSFQKKNGIVYYQHDMSDPFSETKELIGTYCIIKNKRGEFIEMLNKTEIKKMKSVSKMSYIWDNWEGEMWKKSVIKRACKTHFFDVTSNMDALDNEDNYSFDEVEAPKSIYETIDGFTEKQALIDWAGSKMNIPYQNDQAFRSAVSVALTKIGELTNKTE